MISSSLGVSCSSWPHDIIPITLNPHITQLSITHSKITRLDDSFQFYEALASLNLSYNSISSIKDKSFLSQASCHPDFMFYCGHQCWGLLYKSAGHNDGLYRISWKELNCQLQIVFRLLV